jgi:hypothetical protein
MTWKKWSEEKPRTEEYPIWYRWGEPPRAIYMCLDRAPPPVNPQLEVWWRPYTPDPYGE